VGLGGADLLSKAEQERLDKKMDLLGTPKQNRRSSMGVAKDTWPTLAKRRTPGVRQHSLDESAMRTSSALGQRVMHQPRPPAGLEVLARHPSAIFGAQPGGRSRDIVRFAEPSECGVGRHLPHRHGVSPGLRSKVLPVKILRAGRNSVHGTLSRTPKSDSDARPNHREFLRAWLKSFAEGRT
jgi:hypothetical protein